MKPTNIDRDGNRTHLYTYNMCVLPAYTYIIYVSYTWKHLQQNADIIMLTVKRFTHAHAYIFKMNSFENWHFSIMWTIFKRKTSYARCSFIHTQFCCDAFFISLLFFLFHCIFYLIHVCISNPFITHSLHENLDFTSKISPWMKSMNE